MNLSALSRMPESGIWTALVSCAAALALTACGDGGSGGDDVVPPPDPLAAYKSQTLSWGSCLQFVSDDNIDAPHLKALGDRAQCADVRVPLDYDHPDGVHIYVSMLRVKAAESPETKPNLFFNPGGPGGDGQLNAVTFSRLLSNGDPDSVLGRKYKELSEAYNFVGFSPRGVGASTNIECSGNELVYPTNDTRWGEFPENIRRIVDTARYTASNCQKTPVAQYINTDATARDMDLMRHLLGDEKFHYHGTSYGTWLGFWYAGLFPERVGPMVLDSNMNFTASIHDEDISYDRGVVRAYQEYVTPYIARHDDIFGMGTSSDEVIRRLEETVGIEGAWAVNQAMLNVAGNFRADRDFLPEYVSILRAGFEAQKLRVAGKTTAEIKAILTDEDAVYFNDAKYGKAFREAAEELADDLKRREAPNYYDIPKTVSINNFDAVYVAVTCNDEPVLNKDQEYWLNMGFELARDALVVSNTLGDKPCLYWNRQTTVSKPAIDSLKDVPLLLVQSEFDVPTPPQGAMETFELLPAAHMVYVKDEGEHGVFLYKTECVDLTVANYLLGKAPARRLTECAGKPLPFDPQPPADAPSAARAQPQPASPFKDAELAENLLDQLRDATRW